MMHIRRALVARDGMRDASAPQQGRDLATREYARAVDDLVDEMGLLSETQVLGRITLLLARKDRV